MTDPKFASFMGAVLAPTASAMTQHERIRSATCVDDLTDGDMLSMLRHHMLKDGVKPFSQADTILVHLRERVERREAVAEADRRTPVEQALEVLGRALAPLDKMRRECICAGLASLPEHLRDAEKVATTIEAFARLCAAAPPRRAR